MSGVGSSAEDTLRLAAKYRVPNIRYWPAVLGQLKKQQHQAIGLALLETARICHLWLAAVPQRWGAGAAAADLAVGCARSVLARKNARELHDGEIAIRAYEAALYAASDRPEAVSSLVLELCRRRRTQATEDWLSRVSREGEMDSLFPLGRLLEPWPPGPHSPVDDDFANLCFDDPFVLTRLMHTRPRVAGEAILALCIEPPQHEFNYGPRRHDYGTQHRRGCWPPFYFQGPFRSFFHVNPAEAMEVVISLVNFATEVWIAEQLGTGRRDAIVQACSVGIPLDLGTTTWFGDYSVYAWYSAASVGPDSVACALMALEKWLYEQIDSKQPVEEWINSILSRSKSVAFAGVLVAAGLKEPSLFLGPLRALLGIWQIYDWEFKLKSEVRGVGVLDPFTWHKYGNGIVQEVRDWRELRHRQIDLRQLAAFLCLNYPSTRDFFEASRKSCK